jgi:putative zinc finger protein
MEPTQVTCTRVEEEDLDARYLAGTLSEEEAEAFEEHYFGCDRCWATVQLGRDVRAALTADETRPAARPLGAERGTPHRVRELSRRRWFPLAIAASIAIVAIGLWPRGERANRDTGADQLRGPTDSIRAVASVRGRTLLISWPPTPSADRYRVRLQRSDATLVVERIVGDTAFAVSRDSLRNVTDREQAYWEVQALDALGRTIARSRLIPTRVPDA